MDSQSAPAGVERTPDVSHIENGDGVMPRWLEGSGRRRKLANIVSILVGLTFIGSIVFLIADKASRYNGDNGNDSNASNKRNLVFMVSDGMGPASLSLARSFRQYENNLDYSDILNLDKHIIGVSRTRSDDSLVTDSAAGATAFACAAKTYNNAVGVYPDGSACGTVMEAAKLAGYMTGLVVTTRLTDATPAAFSSHVSWRSLEDDVAAQQLGYQGPLGRSVDLLLGGGRCHFHPKSEGGCRKGNENLINRAVVDGWNYVSNVSEFRQLTSSLESPTAASTHLPLLGLLAESDIPFDVDRSAEEYPSLREMADTAIALLDRACQAAGDDCKGFFLLIEGSRIDHAGHNNDPAAQVREVLAYDATFQSVTEYASHAKVDTIVVSTSDHETGGLATARQLTSSYPEYRWNPSALSNATHSSEYVSQYMMTHHSESSESILESQLGIFDYTPAELKLLAAARKSRSRSAIQLLVADFVSVRSQTGWSTHGHSAVDVNVYAHGGNDDLQAYVMSQLAGSNENTQIGDFLRNYLRVDVASVTDKLKHFKVPQRAASALDNHATESDGYHHY